MTQVTQQTAPEILRPLRHFAALMGCGDLLWVVRAANWEWLNPM